MSFFQFGMSILQEEWKKIINQKQKTKTKTLPVNRISLQNPHKMAFESALLDGKSLEMISPCLGGVFSSSHKVSSDFEMKWTY